MRCQGFLLAEIWFHFLHSPPIKQKVIMGRGDKKTAKGKRFRGSYGNSRPHKVKPSVAVSKKTEVVKKEKAPKKVKEVKVEKPKAKKAAAKKAVKKKPE